MERAEWKSVILGELSHVGDPWDGYCPEGIVSLGRHLQEYQDLYAGEMDKLLELWDAVEVAGDDGGKASAGKLMAEFELLEAVQSPERTDRFLDQVLSAGWLGWRNRMYLLRQLESLLFTQTVPAGERTGELGWEIYRMSYTALREEMGGIPAWISREDRTSDLVFVITSQFLSEQHAPTKTALDRCRVLMQSGKRVLLINTAEQGAEIGNILLFRRMRTNYKKILSQKDHITWQGISIPFYQCSPHMPDPVEAVQLVELVLAQRPSCIVNIGGGSLVADLLSEMVPVLTVATVFSGLAMTGAQYQMIGRPLEQKDLRILAQRGRTAEHVISGRFTFSLKAQRQKLTREMLGIPQDRPALIVIGARLEREVTDEFLEMLLGTVRAGAFLVFLGEMDLPSRLVRYPHLEGNAVYLGSRSDVLAVLECVDLYVNPDRRGGGSSVVEAMHQGVVPVTLAHGDVFINTGEAFAVADYGQMQQEIVRCISDPAYHQEKAALARERAAVLLDSYSAFTEVMAEFDRRMEQRERFWVSVIVPCYNVEKYVGKCLDSLLGQTIGAEHIQIIAVDDGSSDGTLDVLKRYEGRYPDSIVLIPLEENVGPGAARNIALEYVLADHVGYVDADDWVEPQMYELLLHEAEEGRLDFAACGYDRTSLRGEMLGYSGEKGTRGEMPGDQKLHAERIVVTDVAQRTAFLEEHRFDIMCTDKLFCTSFLRENHISFAEGVKYEDHYFGMLALLCCKRTSWSRAAMYHWFRNPSGTCMGGQAVLDRISVQTALYQECERRGFTQDHGELLQYDLYEKMVAETIFYLRRQKKDTEGLLPELMGKMAQLGIDIRTNSYYKKHIQ